MDEYQEEQHDDGQAEAEANANYEAQHDQDMEAEEAANNGARAEAEAQQDQAGKPYLIDNEPADMDDIIKLAKELGYEGFGGMFLTSQAAGVIRKHGHTVERAV